MTCIAILKVRVEMDELERQIAEARLSEAKLREQISTDRLHHEEDQLKVLKLFEAYQKHFFAIYQDIFRLRDQTKTASTSSP